MSDTRYTTAHGSEFDRQLADLATAAAGAARVRPAALVRRRARQATVRRRAASGLLTAAVLGGAAFVVLRQMPADQHTPVAATPSPAPSVSAQPSPSPATPSATPSAATSSSASGGGCTPGGLKVTVGAESAGSGHRSVALVFTNVGSTPCTLHGYPGVAALNATGAQIAQATRTPSGYLGGLAPGRAIPYVTLAAGQSASATVEAMAFNASDGSACTAYAGLLVTPPNETRSVRVPWTNDGCSGLEIHPVVPGVTGRSA